MIDSDTDSDPLSDSETNFSDADTEALVDAEEIDSDTDNDPLSDSETNFSEADKELLTDAEAETSESFCKSD